MAGQALKCPMTAQRILDECFIENRTRLLVPALRKKRPPGNRPPRLKSPDRADRETGRGRSHPLFPFFTHLPETFCIIA